MKLYSKNLVYNILGEDSPGITYQFSDDNTLDNYLEFEELLVHTSLRFYNLQKKIEHGKLLSTIEEEDLVFYIKNKFRTTNLSKSLRFTSKMPSIKVRNPNYVIGIKSHSYKMLGYTQKGDDLENKIIKHSVENELKDRNYVD